jgi:indolepyruvate ferredoxin oxidoreductase alpha subunit
LYVIEELEPFIEEHVKTLGISVKSKHHSYRVGELRPELMPSVVNGEEKMAVSSTARKPVMCPGCPHRPVFWTLKKLKATVAGDIGCYTLGALPPLGSLHSCVCMGSGVTFFEGFGKVLGKNVVGIIGDSTFVHSGVTGLTNAASNKATGSLIILGNSTTAMTGSQPNPATGVTIKGEPTKRLCLEELCRVCGADNIDVINPYHVDALESLIKKRMQEDALSVIVARFPCQIAQRTQQQIPFYEKELCKKCKVCLNIDCPALTQTEDEYIEINPALCTGCNLCVGVCKFKGLKRNETK